MRVRNLITAVMAFSGTLAFADIPLTGWKPTAGGAWAEGKGKNGGSAMGLTGIEGKNDKYFSWSSDPVVFKPNGVYGMSFWVNRERSGSEVLCRTSFHDLLRAHVNTGWVELRTLMRAPTSGAKEPIVLSDYNCQARTYFDAPRLVELEPRYRTESGVTLGRGEVMAGNRYYFTSQRACFAGSDTRTLVKFEKASGGGKFALRRDSEVVHRFSVAGRRFLNGRGMLATVYGKDAEIEVDASADGKTWTRLVVITNATPYALSFPPALFPAKEIHLRMKGSANMKKGGLSQVQTVHFDGETDGEPVYLAGATTYFEKGTDRVYAEVDTMKYRVAKPGARLPGSNDALALWGVSSGFKIFRDTPVPAATTDALRLKAAANEAEAVQLVVTPKRDIADLRVEAGPLEAKKWWFFKTGEIPASAVDILRVGYVDVRIVTDKVGQTGLWPDPLPPQDAKPFPVKAGESQPMWVRVKVPKGTPKGVYRGELTVTADGSSVRVPYEVKVFGFEMPDRMTLQAQFGFHPGYVYLYHKAKTQADKDRIREMYVKLLLQNHITPYYWSSDFFPRTKVDLKKMTVDVDFTDWDREMTTVIEKYHGNAVKLAPEGLGGGNHDNRKPAVFGGVKRGDSRYEKLMEQYLRKLVDHLKEKDWLKYAFVYWFDEPTGMDYDFVNEGMASVKKYAPELKRMITNLCAKELMPTIDTWCPTVEHLHVPLEKACRDRGDNMWWYICCSPPDAPIGEHIDHPGTDMRMWGWQTWGEDVSAILVWATEWWTGKAAYPDMKHPQDPYLDPMGWGKSHNPNRIMATWCNGEGRYFYPPLACKDAQQPQTVYDEPVSCYRLELLRDGIEDYEYLAMLKKIDPSSPLLSVPKSVYRDLFDYSHDPEPMETHRERLAREIERRIR